MGEAGQGPTPTPLWEKRLIRAAKRGDRVAQARLLELYEPMVRRISASLAMPGGDRDDLAQHARLGLLDAVAAWDPARRVPFKSFARLCARREAFVALNAARAAKHGPLNGALNLDASVGRDGRPLEETLAAPDRPDEDPVAKALGREQLDDIRRRAASLTELEHRRARAVGQRPRAPRRPRAAGRRRARGQQRAPARPPQAPASASRMTTSAVAGDRAGRRRSPRYRRRTTPMARSAAGRQLPLAVHALNHCAPDRVVRSRAQGTALA